MRARARARYDVASVRVEETWRRVEGSRGRLPLVGVAFETYERDRDVAGPLLAGAMAFRLFLWIVPYTLAVVVILSFVSEIGTRPPTDLAKDAGFGAYLASTVAQTTAQSQQGRWVLLIVALWALFLASRGLAKTLRTSHSLAWGEPIRRGGTSVLALQAGGLLAGLSFLSSLAGALRAQISGPALWIMLVMVVLYFLAWLWLSLHLPHADAPWTALVPGAVLIALGAQALYLISVLWYVPHAASATQTYGSLGLAILFLGWLYI